MESVWIIASGLVFQFGIPTRHVRHAPHRPLSFVSLRLLRVGFFDLACEPVTGKGRVRNEPWRFSVADDVDLLYAVFRPFPLGSLQLSVQKVVGMTTGDQDE